MSYEVQTHTVIDGWVNCWATGTGRKISYKTRELAEAAILEHLAEVKDAVKDGDMLEEYDPADFRVVEKQSRNGINLKMSAVTPDEWLRRLNTIRDHTTRVCVANIVWWDYIGDCKANKVPAFLDAFVSAYRRNMDVKPAKLLAALIKVGYAGGPPYYIAEQRLGLHE
jgi:hypothetical protein